MLLLPTMLLSLAGCKSEEDDFPFIRFNADDDHLVVCVGDGAGCTPVGTTDLLSTNGSTVVGTATVDPESGPVGTVHRIEIDVDDEWSEIVQLAQVELDGDRGTQSWDMQQDSADHGNWVIEVESLGDDGESREDRVDVLLWQYEETTTTTTTTETTESGA